MTKDTTIGVQIAGLGTPAYSFVGGLRLATGGVTIGSVYYLPHLAAWPRQIRTDLDPLKGRVTQSTVEVEIIGIDEPDSGALGGSLGKEVLRFFWNTKKRKMARLTTSVSSSATSWSIQMAPGATDPVIGDVLFCGREAVYVSNVTGTSPALTLTVSRGALGTPGEAHNQRDPYIYDYNPLSIDRELTLYELDPRGPTETRRFAGITENYKLSNNLMRLVVTARDLLGRITDRNLGADRLQGKIKVNRYEDNDNGAMSGRMYLVRSNGPIMPFQPLYADNDGSIGFGDNKVIPIEVDKHAVLLYCLDAPNPVLSDWGYRHSVVGGIHAKSIDGKIIDCGDGGKEYAFREILFADADNSHSLFKDGSGLPTDHPADILRNILASTGTATWSTGGSHTVGENGDYDWLQKNWGLGIPDDLINHPSFDAMVERYPTRGLRARSFYLGQGDDEVPAGDVIFDLAQSMSGYLYINTTGQLAIKHLSDPGPANIDATITAADIASIEGAESGAEAGPHMVAATYAVKLELAQAGPGGDPQFFIKGTDLNDYEVSRLKYLATEEVIESTRIYGDPLTNQLASDLMQRIAQTFASRFAYQSRKLPAYDLTLNNGAPRVSAGMWVSLSHPNFFDVDHSRGISEHRCLVLSGDWSPETGQQSIRVVDWAPASPWTHTIAPSWRITSVTSSTVFDIEANHFTDSADAGFWKNAADGTYPLSLWRADGFRRSTTYREGTLSGSTVTITASFLVTPVVGDILRIAPYVDTYDWPQTESYAYISDSTPTLGSANDDPHLWSI